MSRLACSVRCFSKDWESLADRRPRQGVKGVTVVSLPTEPISVPALDLKAQYRTIRDEIERVVLEVIESQHFILGPEVNALEAEVAAYCGVKSRRRLRVGFRCGVAAADGVGDRAGGRGDHDAVHLLRHRGRDLADGGQAGLRRHRTRDRTTSTPPCSKRRSRPGPGRSSRSTSTARRPRWTRSRRSPGGTAWPSWKTPRRRSVRPMKASATGRFGHASAFSFYPSKNLGAFGDAGMVMTDDADLAQRVARLRVHGMEPKYHHHEVGIQLPARRLAGRRAPGEAPPPRRLDRGSTRGRPAVSGAVRGVGLGRERGAPVGAAGRVSRLQPVRDPRARRCSRPAPRRLAARRIGTEIYYPIPLHLQVCFASLGHHARRLPAIGSRGGRDHRPADLSRAFRGVPAIRRPGDRRVPRGIHAPAKGRRARRLTLSKLHRENPVPQRATTRHRP